MKLLVLLFTAIAATMMLETDAHAEQVFPVSGGKGDRGEQVRCPPGQIMVGIHAKTGAWFDRIGLTCGRFAMPSFRLAAVTRLPARGGSGGVPTTQDCDLDSAIRRIEFSVLNANEQLWSFKFYCSRPADGQVTGDRSIQGNWRPEKDIYGLPDKVALLTNQSCSGSDYAIGLSIRYGKHVNAIGLICGTLVADPAPPPPPPKVPLEQPGGFAPRTDRPPFEQPPIPTPNGADSGGNAPYGAIGEKYAKLGGANGALGQPAGSEGAAPLGGRCQAFQHGTICWHPEIGEAFAVWGSIHDKWAQIGRADFGYPITDERPTPDGRGRYNHFRGMQFPNRPESSIYWTPQTGAHAIYGAIRDAWAQQGWERGPLGYPTSDEHQDGKYRRVTFERGFIRWAPDTGIEIGR